MSHTLLYSASASANGVVDLRRQNNASAGVVSGAQYRKAIKLSLKILKSGSDCRLLVYPVVVADGAAAPSAVTLGTPSNESSNGLIVLSTVYNPMVEVGQQFSPGYSPQVFDEIVATHLLVTNLDAVAAYLQIVVD